MSAKSPYPDQHMLLSLRTKNLVIKALSAFAQAFCVRNGNSVEK